MTTPSVPRILAIMGSGETAPTMNAPHRAIFERLGTDVDAVLLDTPFGFQENAPILASKAIEYFRDAVGRRVEAAGLTRTDSGDTVAVERGVAKVRSADWVFAGPGSPTFALEQWRNTPVPGAIADKLRSGGAVVFSSAAALTLGKATVPVYEIYKVGLDPYWLDGLDVLAEVGLNVAVIPHYDNAEGGNHDTRFCYLGERRLAMLEPELPDGCFVLGIDEHTGVVMDLDADTADIVGKGAVTLRRNGQSVRLESGQTIPIDTLRQGAATPSPAHVSDAAAPGSDLGLTHLSGSSAPGSDLGLTPGQSEAAKEKEQSDAMSTSDHLPRVRRTAPRDPVRHRTRGPRRRWRRRCDPAAGGGDRRVVARHPAVRRRRSGPRRVAVDDRAARLGSDRRRARRTRGARTGGRGRAGRPRRGPVGEGVRRVGRDPRPAR